MADSAIFRRCVTLCLQIRKSGSNLTAANQIEQRQVLEFFRIHPLIAEDFLRERHPPKMEFSDSFSLLILRGFSGPDFSDYPGHSQISVLFNEQVILVKYHNQQDDSKIDLPFSPWSV